MLDIHISGMYVYFPLKWYPICTDSDIMECGRHPNMRPSQKWNVAKLTVIVNGKFLTWTHMNTELVTITMHFATFHFWLRPLVLHIPWIHNHCKWGIIVKGNIQAFQRHKYQVLYYNTKRDIDAQSWVAELFWGVLYYSKLLLIEMCRRYPTKKVPSFF